uniref:Putative mitochondrial protein n=1 Tax=Tanacetum cinerariifolium TaxID=118510 RepID=A0A6L2MR25_TANCI|nr:putative mitochondrial protein [Tanacetum cinerariifolium]
MELLRKHRMEKCDTVTTLIATAKIDADLQGTPTDKTKYRSMIRELMYLTTSRLNIAFATFVCARYQARPIEKHLQEVKRIFRYLRQSVNKGLWYSKDSGFEIITYSYADLVRCLDDYKITSRGLQFLRDKLVSWSSKKQDYTAISTVEAETKYQLADLFTKALPRERFEYLVHKIVFHMAQPIIPAAQLVLKFQVHKVLDTKDTIRFKLDTQDIMYTVDMFHDILQFPVETLENPFVARVNIEIIESFMHTVGYQCVVNKKKDVIQYPRFTKLISADLMKKFPSIPMRLKEDYHSIKDDILLVSVYTTGNVTVGGMLILDTFLTKEIRATYEYNESTPRAHMTPTLTTASPQGKKRKQSAGEISSPQKSLKVTIKQNQVVKVDDDDDNKEEKKDEKKHDEMGSLENRTEKMQTPIPITPRSSRINLSSDKDIDQELTNTVSLSTATTSKDPHKKRHISSKYSHLPGAFRRMCRRQGYMIRDVERKCVTTDEF